MVSFVLLDTGVCLLQTTTFLILVVFYPEITQIYEEPEKQSCMSYP
jgi:hypothetical protein